MKKLLIIAASAAMSLLLAACGGSGSSFGSSTPPPANGSGTVATLAVTSDKASIPVDGSAAANITVVAKDASNNLVTGTAVTITASSGNVTVSQGTTDSNGAAKASLTATGAAAGSTITVTATVGAVTGTVKVTVGASQQTLSLVTSSPQIPSDGSKSATITALVRDANNQFVAGVPVLFQATSGGLAVTQGMTDASGQAIATLSSAGDTTNRTITVTATAGASTATVPVSVVGTKLTLSGPANLVQGAQGTYTLSLTDSSGAGVANQAVTLASAKGNTLSVTTVTTDSTGQKTFTMTGTVGGSDTLTASALGLTATQSVAVSNQTFGFTAPTANAQIPLATNQTVTINWVNAGTAQAGQTIQFSATRGTLSAASAVTDVNGNASVTISSTSAGGSVISATATGVSAQTTVDFLANNPTAITVQASPSTIATQAQSIITATVRDAQNNLVEGKTVNFAITNDITGGTLSVASGVTDASGQAHTVYTASTATSATNGVVVTGTVAGTALSGTASLTVAGQSLFLSLGTGNLINNENTTQDSIDYRVIAIDAAGHAVDGVPIVFNVSSVTYYKGAWGQDTVNNKWIPPFNNAPYTPCPSEDANGNGILDTGEDFNHNTKLDPGLVAASSPGNATTAGGGIALTKVIYPKDHAFYVKVTLTATATVAGTQTTVSDTFVLPALAADIPGDLSSSPPGLVSPYGIANTCSNAN